MIACLNISWQKINFGRLLKNSDVTDRAEFHYKDCPQHKGIDTLLTK